MVWVPWWANGWEIRKLLPRSWAKANESNLEIMEAKQLTGWILVVLAGAISASIVSFEVVNLVHGVNAETSEGLPVVGFEPIDKN